MTIRSSFRRARARRKVSAWTVACTITGVLWSPAASAQATRFPQRQVRQVMVVGQDATSPDYLFGFVSSVCPMPSGGIVVADLQDAVIRTFDSTGRFMLRFGRKGQGPGEFNSPSSVTIRDTIIEVRDLSRRRVSEFTMSGRHVRTRTLTQAEWLRRVIPLRDGSVLVAQTPVARSLFNPGDPAPLFEVVGVQRRGQTGIDTLLRIRMDSVYMTRVGARGVPSAVRTRFGRGGAWAMHADSVLAHVDGYAGLVSWYDLSPERPRLFRTEQLGITGRPVTLADVDAEAARLGSVAITVASDAGGANAAAGAVRLLAVPTQWSVATEALFSTDGALWVGNPRRTHVRRGNQRPELIAEPNDWIVYPRNAAAFRVSLPPMFRLTGAAGTRVYGVLTTADGLTLPAVFAIE